MKKSILLFALVPFCFAQQRAPRFVNQQPTATYEFVAPGCPASMPFMESLTNGCLFTQMKVTIHPSNPNAVGAFLLVIYTSQTFAGFKVVQPHFTSEKNADGNFIAVFPSGDMIDPIISAVEVAPGSFITAQASE